MWRRAACSARGLRSAQGLVGEAVRRRSGHIAVTLTARELQLPVALTAFRWHCGSALTAHLVHYERAFSSSSGKPHASLDEAKAASSSAIKTKESDIQTSQREVKDAMLICETVWRNLVAKYGEDKLIFPKDIMWLAGAPGSGKGRMTPFIKEFRGLSADPVSVSQLLSSPEAKKIMDSGQLVNDRVVIELLFEQLLQPKYNSGIIVDGFPRTRVQAEALKFLFDKMRTTRRPDGTLHSRRPIFHITVLYVEEPVSIRRQLQRGLQALAHNKTVLQTGVGQKVEVRATDVDENKARERYRQFTEQVYESLQAIKEKFHFHFINADGTPEEVQERIVEELKYQSSMELPDETFELVRKLPLASEIIQNARYELVKRLEHYSSPENVARFTRVIDVLQKEFFPIIQIQAISGKAIIRSMNAVFEESLAINMALDIMSERGYVVVLDYKKKFRPGGEDKLTVEQKVFEFHIEFARPTIRRG